MLPLAPVLAIMTYFHILYNLRARPALQVATMAAARTYLGSLAGEKSNLLSPSPLPAGPWAPQDYPAPPPPPGHPHEGVPDGGGAGGHPAGPVVLPGHPAQPPQRHPQDGVPAAGQAGRSCPVEPLPTHHLPNTVFSLSGYSCRVRGVPEP